MLRRCYDPKSHRNNPTYIGVEVHNDWLNFQVFAKWFKYHYKEDGWQLDKDLLGNNSKVYSADNCIFLPAKLNSFISSETTLTKDINRTGFKGVKKQGIKYVARIHDIDTGKELRSKLYDTAEEASEAYKRARKFYANKWKEYMEGIIPQKAIDNIK
jgi:hypothetical protein